jgi:hypothetical protein
MIWGVLFLLVGITASYGQSLGPSELLQAASYDDEKALARLSQIGEQGNAEAQFLLGYYFQNKVADQSTAAYWYRRAAKSGHRVATMTLAEHYLLGRAEAASPVTAISLLKGLAARGDIEAQLKLGLAYRFPRADGKPHNSKEAVRWLTKAGRQKNPHAMLVLTEMFTSGAGVRRDAAMAVQLLTAGARLGDRACPYLLARRYVEGDGVPQDTAKALKELEELGYMGFPDAVLEVGLIHLEGRGGHKKDLGEGLRQIRIAAVSGSAAARLKLGEMYYHGVGVEADRVLAYEWVYLAAKKQLKAAQQFLLLLDMTTPAGIRQEALEKAANEKTGVFCATPFLKARLADEKARAQDKSPHPVIDWDSLLKSAQR